jgi:hypothetical protein
VTAEGKPIAIAGASFGSTGDVASKGTGGGLVSMNCEGPTKFIGPGCLDVQIEGKNVHLLGDPMLNNCGPSGSPPNAATMTGVIQGPGPMTFIYGDDAPCPLCEQTHPIPEGEEVGACLSKVFKNLRERLQEFNEELEGLDIADDPRKAAFQLARVVSERNILMGYLQSEAVLRFDPFETASFTRGYMVGSLVCACRTAKKCLVTTSGSSPPGFVKATKGTGFTFVGNTFQPTPAQLRVVAAVNPGREVWSCAAPKLIDAADGHQASQMLEMMYAPRGPGPKVTFKVRTLDAAGREKKVEEMTKRFKGGDKVPSCEICQKLLPGMVCKAKCN